MKIAKLTPTKAFTAYTKLRKRGDVLSAKAERLYDAAEDLMNNLAITISRLEAGDIVAVRDFETNRITHHRIRAIRGAVKGDMRQIVPYALTYRCTKAGLIRSRGTSISTDELSRACRVVPSAASAKSAVKKSG